MNRYRNRSSLKSILSGAAALVAVYCKDKIQYKEVLEYLEYNEWGLAYNTLIELAEDAGCCFPVEFWLKLSIAADRMNLKEQANYCRKKITEAEKIKE
ncbi:MAG: hypothetical protein QM791_04545 [Ferruginibacter sp.]